MIREQTHSANCARKQKRHKEIRKHEKAPPLRRTQRAVAHLARAARHLLLFSGEGAGTRTARVPLKRKEMMLQRNRTYRALRAAAISNRQSIDIQTRLISCVASFASGISMPLWNAASHDTFHPAQTRAVPRWASKRCCCAYTTRINAAYKIAAEKGESSAQEK